MRLLLPEHLELLLTGEPVLDVYAEGPWRVPGGLAGQVHERARDLDSSEEARSLRATVPEKIRIGQTAVAQDLMLLTSYLCGVGAVRGGSRCYPELDFFGPFLPGPAPPDDRDPVQWMSDASRWRPPGAWIFDHPERQDAAFALALACVQALDGITPFERRRQALLGLFARQMPGGTPPPGPPAALDDLEAGWAAAATPGELAVLPELADPAGYLAWACDGLAAAHQRLARAVPGTPPAEEAIASLVLQAGLQDPPGGVRLNCEVLGLRRSVR